MKIAIYSQKYKPEYDTSLIAIFRNVNGEDQVWVKEDLWVEFSARYFLENNVYTFNNPHDLDDSFDFMITVGGDGTILRGMTFVHQHLIPILGINVGRMGFLAKVEKDEIERMFMRLRKRDYVISERTILEVVTSEGYKIDQFNYALNDVTLRKMNLASMITIKAELNGSYLTSYWSDGVVVSTATGSTAYNLSCGGPIVMPVTDSLVITPISPHNLNVRPLIIPTNFEITFEVISREDGYFLTFDSRIMELPCKQKIVVRKSLFSLRMIDFEGEAKSFINSLRSKLHWNDDIRN